MDFCLLPEIWENIGKNISKNLSGKYSQTLIDHAKQTAAGERESLAIKQLLDTLFFSIKMCTGFSIILCNLIVFRYIFLLSPQAVR